MGRKLSENTLQTLDLAAAAEKEEKKREKKEKKKKKNTKKAILLASIAAFLESNGFSKSLSTLRSEAELETDDLKATYPNLEDVFCKFLESSVGDEENNIYRWDERDTEDGSIARKNDENKHDAPAQILKKKRKKNARNDDGTKDGMRHENDCDDRLEKSADKMDLKDLMSDDKRSDQNNGLDDSYAETKSKNRKKKANSDSLGKDNAKKELELPCETVHNVDPRSQVLDSHVNVKDRKKKRHKMISNSSGECVEGESQGKLKDIVMDKVEELKSVISNSSTELLDSSIKHKDKRKKKPKSTSDYLGENAERLNLEVSHKVVDEDSKDLNSLGVENNTQLLGKKDDKGKRKKKRDGSTPECLNAMSSDQLDKGGQIKSIVDHEIQDSLKVPDSGTENTASGEQIEDVGKNSKKRKRLSSEETRSEMDIDVATKESKQVISEAAEGTNETSTLPSSDTSLQDIEPQGLAKKRKMEKSSEDGLLANHSENNSVQASEEDRMANGYLSKNEKEERSSSKGMKKEKRSAEPKTFNAFQRVKVDEVKFADERLQDNSYWAKGGADIGYGAKAQEILGQVRGRDFRHEKTKKKRGTYRGGEIDLQSHSIKFNYSDDE